MISRQFFCSPPDCARCPHDAFSHDIAEALAFKQRLKIAVKKALAADFFKGKSGFLSTDKALFNAGVEPVEQFRHFRCTHPGLVAGRGGQKALIALLAVVMGFFPVRVEKNRGAEFAVLDCAGDVPEDAAGASGRASLARGAADKLYASDHGLHWLPALDEAAYCPVDLFELIRAGDGHCAFGLKHNGLDVL